jgi:hypothetical protein
MYDLMDGFREIAMDVDKTGEALGRLYKTSFWWLEAVFGKANVVLPFIHDLVLDYGMIILSPFSLNDKIIEIVVIEYCEDSLFTKARYDKFLVAGFSKFLSIMLNFQLGELVKPKLSFKRFVFSEGFSRRSLRNDEPTCLDGGMSLCKDLQSIARQGAASFVKEVVLDAANGKPRECASIAFTRRFQSVILDLRSRFFDRFLPKVTFLLGEWINSKFNTGQAELMAVGKDVIRSLFVLGDVRREKFTIDSLAEDVLTSFLKVFRPCLAYESEIPSLAQENFKLFGFMNIPTWKDHPRFSRANCTIDIPYENFYECWKRRMALDPKSVWDASLESLKELIQFPLRRSNDLFSNYNQLEESNEKVKCAFAVDPDINPGINRICSMEFENVCTIIELFQYSIPPPAGTMLLYTDGITLFDKNGGYGSFNILPGVLRIICLVGDLKDQHFGVLEILTTEKQVVVYDGMDGTPTLMLMYPRNDGNQLFKPGSTSEQMDAADRLFSKIAAQILVLLGLISEEAIEANLTIFSDNLKAIWKPGVNWRIVSVCFFREDWKDHLICQNDGYSCGYIAVLHVMKLMGHNIAIRYELTADWCIPQMPGVTMVEEFEKRVDMNEAIRKWISEFIGIAEIASPKRLLTGPTDEIEEATTIDIEAESFVKLCKGYGLLTGPTDEIEEVTTTAAIQTNDMEAKSVAESSAQVVNSSSDSPAPANEKATQAAETEAETRFGALGPADEKATNGKATQPADTEAESRAKRSAQGANSSDTEAKSLSKTSVQGGNSSSEMLDSSNSVSKIVLVETDALGPADEKATEPMDKEAENPATISALRAKCSAETVETEAATTSTSTSANEKEIEFQVTDTEAETRTAISDMVAGSARNSSAAIVEDSSLPLEEKFSEGFRQNLESNLPV